MIYMLTGIESHSDLGFGITGDAYYKTGEHLRSSPIPNHDVTSQVDMPENFLFRHSIELYIKSLIILFHRELRINYGTMPYNTKDPQILTKAKWKSL
jgi:hypothetical protein